MSPCTLRSYSAYVMHVHVHVCMSLAAGPLTPAEAVTSALVDSELLPELSKLLSSSDSPPEVLTNALVLVDSLGSGQTGTAVSADQSCPV